ncbi:MAG TPA: hypothetical protein VML55_09390 [Planctomycetaceae bacterium]|nr:hypothetical protein [Planctomycetaceae bacterium]
MKTTVDLPDKLLRQIKLQAVKRGQRLKDFMADLLRKGLAANSPRGTLPERPTIKADPRTGFPYIECAPDAPARRMTVEEIIAIEEDTQIQETLERLGVSP